MKTTVSVVIPAYRAWATLPDVLDALESQVRDRGREVVLVDSSADGGAEQTARVRPWLQVVALSERTLPGRARNLGFQRAQGDLIAFLDADAIPEPGWLDALLDAQKTECDAVAGAVLNGTPRNPIGIASHLLEFADWSPARREPVLHGASCNLLVRRRALEGQGGFPEDFWPGEDTVLTFRLAAESRLCFASGARARHLNRTGFREFLTHQRRLGIAFAHICARVDFPRGWMARLPMAPLGVPFRLLALGRRLWYRPRDAALALLVSPLLVAGLVAWSVGLAQGRREVGS